VTKNKASGMRQLPGTAPFVIPAATRAATEQRDFVTADERSLMRVEDPSDKAD